ncbi:MAG: DEAD/DEAH box helicase [Prolixibacteraceae bacterium]
MKNFEELGIRKEFVLGLNELNIIKPTQIQNEVIPLLLGHNTDLVGQAQTGTGKTAAYGLPLLQKINPTKPYVQGLILCPTRELGQQIAKQLFKFTKYSEKIFTEAVFGGSHITIQMNNLKRTTHIIVATPGRLIDLVNRKSVDLTHVRTVILDEADEMLSMGFKKELDEILGSLIKIENTWLFSATIPHGIQQIVKDHMKPNAHRIVIEGRNVVNKDIDHQYFICSEEEKLSKLMQMIKAEPGIRGVVFCRTKARAQQLAKQLIAKNVAADAIHGDLLQKERDKVMRAFKKDRIQLLIATDLAARGLDVEGLSFVVHYQLPESEEYYTHRSGRTARAGKKGISLCLVSVAEVSKLKDYEKSLNISFTKID